MAMKTPVSPPGTKSVARLIAAVWVLAMLSLPASGQQGSSIADEVRKLCTGLPFAMPDIAVPSFPEKRINIVDVGAKADGRTMNTAAINGAIHSCSVSGGGTVVIPAGTWLTGPIRLEDNVNLRVERGALVQFSEKIEDFPLVAGLNGKSKKYVVSPPLSAYGAKNIAITGDGVFDGAGEVWRFVKKEKLTQRQWKSLVASSGAVSDDGKEWWPSKEAMEGEAYLSGLELSGKKLSASDYAKAREFLRPDLLRFERCKGILLDGPTFQNSPRFHVHPVQCEDLIVRNIKVFTEWYAQNGDGLDLSSCKNVVVYDVTMSVGDDGICVKPGSSAHGDAEAPSCENIVVADCIVYHAHGGFVIGSESHGGARNISVRNCIFDGTDVGLRFKSLRGRGGLVEGVFIDGIQMRSIVNEAILFDMFYGGAAPEEEAMKSPDESTREPVDDRTPRFQNFSIANVTCNGAQRAILVQGLPEMPVKNLRLDNVSIAAQKGVLCRDVDSLTISASSISAKESPLVSVVQGRNITISTMQCPPRTSVFLSVEGAASEAIRLVGVDLSNAETGVSLGKDVRPNAVSKQ